MKKITTFILIITAFFVGAPVYAINNPVLPVNEPIVSVITNTSATVSVPQQFIDTLTAEQKAGLYFEYGETNQVCIMIYPTPESCLPKKTAKGALTQTLSGLKPNTSYSVSYKVDNTIMCITTPCPGNGVESNKVQFITSSNSTSGQATLSRNLSYRFRGAEVVMLQDMLRARGYLTTTSTGYFGIATFKAVKAFQKANSIAPTGFVGPLTRAALNKGIGNTAEYFEGTIQAVSTACFADGICSVTIDGKVVVTTIGWSQNTVGAIKGSVTSIGDIETKKIGARAKVYAAKTTEGYSLYGSSAYYIEVL